VCVCGGRTKMENFQRFLGGRTDYTVRGDYTPIIKVFSC